MTPYRNRYRVLTTLLSLFLASQPLFVRPSVADEDDAPRAGAEDEEEHGESRFTVEALEKFGVHVAAAGPGMVDVAIELPGEVRPNANRVAHIAPRFPGLVREVRKEIGDTVKAGDILATIESENLATYSLKAAMDGTVIDRDITPGEAVGPETPAFVIADLSTVWVLLNVYQKVLPELRIGQRVAIAADTTEAEGSIAYITPVIDHVTRTASARVVLANQDGRWRPGLFVAAMVLNPVKADVVIPRQAVQTVGGKNAVFVVDGEHFRAREVAVGRVGHSMVEITEGLRPGERYAREEAFLVKAELEKGEAGDED
jgi:cobalt-zinc-cadmium efflux system membrane fusion protein